MQNKPTPHADLKRRIARAVNERGETVSELARLAGVDQGHASRIVRGQFQRVSQNVMQICKILDVVLDDAETTERTMQEHLVAELFAIWDRTPEDADRIRRLLSSVKDLRG